MPPSIVSFTEEVLGLSLSPAQRTLLKSFYGEPLNAKERMLFTLCTGRERYPGHPFQELTVIAGSRSGKDSRVATPIVCYEACFGEHTAHAIPGESVKIPLVAQNRAAAHVAFEYIRAAFERPLLQDQVVRSPGRGRSAVTADELRLRNGLTVQCFSCTKASVRGYSLPVAVLDELAFFRLEGSADSDVEIQTSVRRGMVSFPAPKLVKISTPYMRSGVLHDDHKNFFGVDSPDVLVWVAATTLMNPSVTEERLARERRVMDSARFRREYEAIFAEDVSAFLNSEWVDNAVELGVHERPPLSGVRYVAAADPSGGGADAQTLAVVHAEGTGGARRVVHDVLKSWTRFTDREGAVAEAAATLKRYGLAKVVGDRYAGAWVREAFKRHGITYEDALIRRDGEDTYLDRSAAYLEVEPLFASGLISLLDHPQLARELRNLERRPSQGGRDRIEHPRGQHDDHANALALAAAIARQGGTVKPMAGAVRGSGLGGSGGGSILDSVGRFARDRWG